mgnify:CR=1 FL=1
MQSHLVKLPGGKSFGGADAVQRSEPIGVYLYKCGTETQRRRELKIQASVVDHKQAAEPKLTQKSMEIFRCAYFLSFYFFLLHFITEFSTN